MLLSINGPYLINGTLKLSTFDHIYTNNSTLLKGLNLVTPIFVYHLQIFFDHCLVDRSKVITLKRDWCNYFRELLYSELNKLNWNIVVLGAQGYWDIFEFLLVNVFDSLVPNVKFLNNVNFAKCKEKLAQ
jgi:hypothetical protein